MNEFVAKKGLISQGNVFVTGSATATNGFIGTASWANNSIVSNTSLYASQSNWAISASFASSSVSSTLADSVSSISANITNNADNRVLTATGGGSINGESNLLFNGNSLALLNSNISTNSPDSGSTTTGLRMDAGEGFSIYGNTSFFGTALDAIIFQMEDVNSVGGNTDGGFVFRGYSPTGGNPTSSNWMTIKTGGKVGINTMYPTTTLHVQGHISASGFGSGSLQGTASYADRSTVSATSLYASQSNWAISASFASSSVSSSLAKSASYVNGAYVKASTTLGIPNISWGTSVGAWLEVSERLQGNAYLGYSERIIVDLYGGLYADQGWTRYIVDGRTSVSVDRIDFNGGVPDASHTLKVYGIDTELNDSTGKFIIGVRITSGSFYAHQAKAYTTATGEYVAITSNTAEPTGSGYTDNTPATFNRYSTVISGSSYPINVSWASSSISSSFATTAINATNATNISGGTDDYVAVWNGTNALTSGLIRDDGDCVGVGAAPLTTDGLIVRKTFSADIAGEQYGIRSAMIFSGTGSNYRQSFRASSNISNTIGTLSNYADYLGYLVKNQGGDVTTLSTLYSGGSTNSGSIANRMGLFVTNFQKTSPGTITSEHGVYINDLSGALGHSSGLRTLLGNRANTWNIYSEGTAPNYFAGNIGIGTTLPTTKLEINAGGILMTGGSSISSSFSELFMGWRPGGGGWARGMGWISGSVVQAIVGGFGNGTTGVFDYLYFGSGSNAYQNTWMVIKNSGNVGIGTTNPSAKLQVVGNVVATSFTGSLSGNATTSTTAAFSDNSTSASYAKTASFIGSGTNNYIPKWANNTLTATSSIIDTGSYVGIGTFGLIVTPNKMLHLSGDDSSGGIGTGNVALRLTNRNISAAGKVSEIQFASHNLNQHVDSQSFATLTGVVVAAGAGTFCRGDLAISTRNNSGIITDRLWVKADGNVGIGTSTPQALLHVFGTVSASNYIGNLTGNASTATTSTSASYATTSSYSISTVQQITSSQVTVTSASWASSSLSASYSRTSSISVSASYARTASYSINASTAVTAAYADNAGNASYANDAFTAGTATTATTALSVANDSVILGTSTTGNYLATINAGTNLTSTNNTPSEGTNPTISLASTITLTGVTASLRGNVVGDLSGNATTATTSTTANGLAAGTYAITSSWANNAVYAETSNTAAYATNAGYATMAGTATAASTATSADSVAAADIVGTIAWSQLPYQPLRSTVSYSSPLTITVGPSYSITASIALANGSTSGYLSSTDWNTFNNKQNSLTTGATYNITSSWANNAVTSAYASNANIANVAFEVAADSVILGTSTTGNYVASINAGTNLVAANNTPAENTNPTISLASQISLTGVTASLLGNVTGNVVGNLTGNASTATTANESATAEACWNPSVLNIQAGGNIVVESGGSFFPYYDSTISFGLGGNKWHYIYAVNGIFSQTVSSPTITCNEKLILPPSSALSPNARMMFFDESTNTLYIHNGTTWKSVVLT